MSGWFGSQKTGTATQKSKSTARWYLAQNNYFEELKATENSFRSVKVEYQGKSETVTGPDGKTKEQRQAKFDDDGFPGNNDSWWVDGEMDEMTELPVPHEPWPRLGEWGMTSSPYPMAHASNRNPAMGRVHQGAIHDHYFTQAMQAVGMKGKCVRDLFLHADPNLGVFVIRLYKHAQWVHLVIDDKIPVNKAGDPLCSTSDNFPFIAWPALVEKAYARLHGSWEAIGDGGHVEEALVDLTGGVASRICTKDVAPDRLFEYLYRIQDHAVFACTVDEAECSKRNVPLEAHWAASLSRVERFEGRAYACVCLNAPPHILQRLGAVKLPNDPGRGLGDGFVWLNMTDFHQYISTIYEVRLVNTDLGPPPTGPGWTPGWKDGESLFEEIWAYPGVVTGANAPVFVMKLDRVPVEGLLLLMEASQTDKRVQHKGRSEHTKPAPLLVRFYQCADEDTSLFENFGDPNTAGENGMPQKEINMVHCSAWGYCRDALCVVKVEKPGTYVIMVSMPGSGISCRKLIFRTYSNMKISLRAPFEAHEHRYVPTVPDAPLNAIPFSLVGMCRVDTIRDFDTEEGKGIAHSSAKAARKGQGGGRGMDSKYRSVGSFGGRNAHATVDVSEDEGSKCCVQ